MSSHRVWRAPAARAWIAVFGLLFLGCSGGGGGSISPSATLIGLVRLPNGQAAAGAAVEFVGLPLPAPSGLTHVTGPDGRFSLAGIPVGAYPVMIRATWTHPGGAAFAANSNVVTAAAGEVVDVGILTLASTSLDVAYAPQSLSDNGGDSDVADLNGDGAPDLVVYSGFGAGPIDVRLNRGDGSFAPPMTFGTGFLFVSFHEVADFDADGDQDVLIARSDAPDETARLYRNDGHGVFSASADMALPGDSIASFIARDMNGDQAADLVLLTLPAYTVRILSFDGVGAFQETYQTPASLTLGRLKVEDFDGDHAPDLLFVNALPANLVLRRNLGAAGFGPDAVTPTFSGFAFNNVTLFADIDHDGDKDIIVDAATGGSGPAIVRNDAGVLTVIGFAPVSYQPLIAAGDLDGDGAAEIVAWHYQNGYRFAVLKSDGTGANFQPGADVLTRAAPVDGRIVDFDLDGKNDLLLSTGSPTQSPQSISLYLQSSGGALRAAQPVLGFSGARASAAIDVNGDGRADLVATDELSGVVRIRIALTDGTFAPASAPIATGAKARALAGADLDNDGDAEILVCNEAADTVSVLTNDGTGSFQKTADLAGGDVPRGLVVADLNNDSYPDLAVVAFGDAEVRVFLGDGIGGFGAPQILAGAINQRAITAADMDADGDRDLIVVTDGYGDYVESSVGVVTTGGLSLYANSGNATFAAPTPIATSLVHPMAAAAADFDGDGKMDLAVAGRDFPTMRAELLRSLGNGAFAATALSATVTDTLSVADLDLDGAPDLVASSLYYGAVVYRNDRAGGFEYPKFYDGLMGTYGAAVGDVNGDGRTDIITVVSGVGQIVVFPNL